MQVIILGDVHLGKNVNIGKTGIGTSLNSRIVDQLNLLDWTLDQAIDKSADHIIITGDIFEEPKPHPALITMFIGWLKKCQVNNLHVHIVIGNHDMLRNGSVIYSPLDIVSEMDLENVSVYKQIDTIAIGTTSFTFMPFRDRKSLNCNNNSSAVELLQECLTYELTGIPITYHKVLVGHLAIEGSVPVGDEIDDMSDILFCPLDMFKGYDYVWMGHVHKPQVLKKKPYISHIGSMDISNFGETEQQKYIVVFDCNTGKFDTQNLPTRNLRKISISVPKDTKDTTAYVTSQLKKMGNVFDKAIVRVEVALASPTLKSVNKSTIERFLNNSGAFNVAGISESKKVALIKRSSSAVIDTKMDVVSAIKAYADAHVEDSKRSTFIEVSMEIYNQYKVENKE